jgi:hypothetical protein
MNHWPQTPKLIIILKKKKGIGSFAFQIKSILYISNEMLRFKIDTSNGVYDFTLFKFLKNMLTLTLYTPLYTQTLNPDISFKMDSTNFIK